MRRRAANDRPFFTPSTASMSWLSSSTSISSLSSNGTAPVCGFKLVLESNALVSLELQMLDHTMPLLLKCGWRLLHAPEGSGGSITSDGPFGSCGAITHCERVLMPRSRDDRNKYLLPDISSVGCRRGI